MDVTGGLSVGLVCALRETRPLSSDYPPPTTNTSDPSAGQAPKLNTAPLVQLDTGSKYYKVMIDGMMYNFKKAVNRASEKSFSLNNITTSKPINLVAPSSPGSPAQQRVSIQDLQIDGLGSPKVSTVYVNKKNMKLHVVFSYKTIRVSGKCITTPQKPAALPSTSNAKILLEATNWNTSWSANIMPMVGREHFDMSKVYTSHAQQRLSLNLKECPQSMHEKLKTVLMDRIKSSIDSRLIEIMETVIMQTDTVNEDFVTPTSTPATNPEAPKAKERGKRASDQRAKVPRQTKAALKSPKTSPRKPNPIKSAIQVGDSRPKDLKSPRRANQTVNSRAGTKGLKSPVAPRAPSPSNSQRALKRTKRQTPCQQGEELDDYVDQLFRFGTRIVRAMEPITLPNTTIELPDYNLKIFLYEGKGTRAYKFRRTKPAWVFCSNETISLGLTIEVEELRVAYKYRVISGHRLLFDGDLEARLSPKVQAQFSQAVQEEDSEEPVMQRVDRVRVFRLGRVFVLIRGLGNLTQSLSMLINSYLNDNQEELQPTFRMVEGDAVRMINRMLANVNVPLLSVV